MGEPLVSVIVPAYNCEKTLEETVRPVLAQTCGAWEMYIVDDASADNTRGVIEYLARLDLWIRPVFCVQNGGVACARNRGIDWARGKYIAFLAGDECWEPDKLACQLAVMERSGCGLFYTSYDFMVDRRPTGKAYTVPVSIDYKGILGENVVGCSTVLLRKGALGDQRLDRRFSHEDYALWLQLLRGSVSLGGISDVLVHYRMGGPVGREVEGRPGPVAGVPPGREAVNNSGLLVFYGVCTARDIQALPGLNRRYPSLFVSAVPWYTIGTRKHKWDKPC